MKKGYQKTEARQCLDYCYKAYQGESGVFTLCSKDQAHLCLSVYTDNACNYFLTITSTAKKSVLDYLFDASMYTQSQFLDYFTKTSSPKVATSTYIEFLSLKTGLAEYLDTLPASTNLFITGHGMKASICSLISLWIDRFFFKRFSTKTYIFGAFSIGNSDYKGLMQKNASYGIYSTINPKDTTAYLFTNSKLHTKRNSECGAPFLYRLLFMSSCLLLKILKIKYEHAGKTILLRKKSAKGSSSIGRSEHASFHKMAAENHSIATYRSLLDD